MFSWNVLVRVEGIEPPCNQLSFQDLIRVREYTRKVVAAEGVEPSHQAPKARALPLCKAAINWRSMQDSNLQPTD